MNLIERIIKQIFNKDYVKFYNTNIENNLNNEYIISDENNNKKYVINGQKLCRLRLVHFYFYGADVADIIIYIYVYKKSDGTYAALHRDKKEKTIYGYKIFETLSELLNYYNVDKSIINSFIQHGLLPVDAVSPEIINI